jgi:hypothetical protein
MSENLAAQVSHWKNEVFLLKKTLASYNHTFVFLCASMERTQLCKVISKIKSNNDAPLPPAIRNFLSRNVSVDVNRNEDQSDVNNESFSIKTYPIITSAEALTNWAKRHLKKLQIRGNSEGSSKNQMDSEQDSSLVLAETNFKLRDLEQQLRSSQAIREDLLNKALEAEQQRRMTVIETVKNVNVAKNFSVSSQNNGRSSIDIQSIRGSEMQWKSKYYELQANYEQLQKQLKEANNHAVLAKNGKTESKASLLDDQQKWMQSELKNAKSTIRQLRALVQAKQDKIDIMEQLKIIPRRG